MSSLFATIIVVIAATRLPAELGVLILGLGCIVQLPLAIPWRWLGVADRNTG